jgi:K+-sensing histidine kinase KdpD
VPKSGKPTVAKAPAHPAWLARLAHDLRDPITPLRFAVQQLQSGQVGPEDASALLRLMDRQIDAVLAMADEIADLIRIERGEFVLHLAPASLADIVSAAVRAIARGGSPGAAPVSVHCAAECLVVEAEDRRLVQLLAHLLRLLGAGSHEEARPLIECDGDDDSICLHLRDSARSLTPSPRLDYLMTGIAPADTRVLLMSNLIAREILVQHHATLHVSDADANGSTALVLHLRRGVLPSFVAA